MSETIVAPNTAGLVAEPANLNPTATPPATPVAPPQPFLGGSPPPVAEPDPNAPQPVVAPKHFLSDTFHKDGVFNEGWSKAFEEKGFPKLAADAAKYPTEAKWLEGIENKIAMLGRKGTTGIPDETWDPKDATEWRKNAGVPESPEGYEIKPKEIPPGVTWDEEKATRVSALLHKFNAPKGPAEALVADQIADMDSQNKAAIGHFDTQVTEAATKAETTFKREWGADYDGRLESNRAYVSTLFTPEEMDSPVVKAALSNEKFVRILDENRRNLRGQVPPAQGSEVPASTLTPGKAAAAIMQEKNWNMDPEKRSTVKRLFDEQASLDNRAAGRK